MAKKLGIWLPKDWANVSDRYLDGPMSLAWNNSAATGTFQISTAEYKGGREPRSTEADLIRLAIGFGEQNKWGELIGSGSGKCAMGTLGTAAFRPTKPMPQEGPAYYQVWFLSNGRDFVIGTFIATEEPPKEEIASAGRIAANIKFQ